MKKTAQPSDLELQVLSVLWELGPSTVHEMLPAMPDGKPRAYTTVLSVMQVMEKKGLVKHTAAGRTHVYRAAVTKRQALGPVLRGLVKNVFGGSASLAVQQLVKETDINAGELAEIRKVLDNVSRRKKKGGK